MVYKVLSIIAGILMSLTGMVLVVCLLYTLGAPLLQAGVDGVRRSLEESVASAVGAVGLDAGAIAGGDWRAHLDDMVSAAMGAAGAAVPLGGAGTVAGGGTSAQDEAYARWKGVVGDPVGSVLAGSGVSAAVLQGIAGGSSSASDVLTGLDETALTAIYANAGRYASNVAAVEVSSTLPDAVRAQLWEANSAAQSFAAAVQQLVGDVRAFKGGDVGALLQLAGDAAAASSNANTISTCMANAEALL